VKLEGYGIVLTRLTAHDLELVRVKRNSEEVRSYMQFRDEITPEMQVKWFSSIDNEHNNYFLIHHGDEKVGMISGAEIDWTTMETQWRIVYLGSFSLGNSYSTDGRTFADGIIVPLRIQEELRSGIASEHKSD
jgi:UDP-4-amino-4,6-dideoxy-N-acetyl-beta-L-altrosamine N-acetyltransferase